MNHSKPIFQIQLDLLKREKGMMIFYLLCVVLIGIILPVFFHNTEQILIIAALFTVSFLKPILSDSLAGEKERKTLESILSAPINNRDIILGKLKFSCAFAVTFFFLIIFCTILTTYLIGDKSTLAIWQWICIILFSILNFITISIIGISISAVSIDLQTANHHISKVAYPFGLLNIIYLSIMSLLQMSVMLIISGILAIFYFLIIGIYAVKILRMKRFHYFENRIVKKFNNRNKKSVVSIAPKSHFSIVFWHELKYLLKLKSLLINFLLLCTFPAIIICLFKYYTGQINLYYAVFLTALIMPRTPTNLIAYSIGGEKVYKTGESLLSTPLHLKPLFLAKCMIPVFISVIMLIISSLFTLITANLIGSFFEAGTIYKYTADQFLLLFPVGIMSCITMVFITGILSLNMKTPRQGLYVSTIVGFVFVIPPLIIVFLTQDRLRGAIFYFLFLLLCNILCIRNLSDKITRPYILNKL